MNATFVDRIAALVVPGDLIDTEHGPVLVLRVLQDTDQGVTTIDATCLSCARGGVYPVASGSTVKVNRIGK